MTDNQARARVSRGTVNKKEKLTQLFVDIAVFNLPEGEKKSNDCTRTLIAFIAPHINTHQNENKTTSESIAAKKKSSEGGKKQNEIDFLTKT